MLGPSSMAFVRLERQVPALCTRFARHFHASPHCAAAARAPSTRRRLLEAKLKKVQEDQWEATPGRPIDMNDAQWEEYQTLLRLPDPLLQAAVQDGLLDASLTTVRSTANRLIRVIYSIPEPVPKASIYSIHDGELPSTSAPPNSHCPNSPPHSIDLSLVSGVALILMRSPTHRNIAVRALRNIARTDEPISVLALGIWALHAKNSTRKTEIYRSVTKLAEQGTVPQALVLYARFLESPKAAAEALRKAMKISTPVKKPTSIDAFIPDVIPPAWLEYADLMIKEKNHQEARRVLAIGTDEYDSPEAWLRLARSAFDSNNMNRYEECLTKSAMAGNVDSAYLLANLYLAVHLRMSRPLVVWNHDPEEFHSKYGRGDYRKLAQEWYEIAVASGKGMAGLVLAGLYRREGKKFNDAKRYLDVALEDPVSRKRANTMIRRWSDTKWRVDILEDLMKETTPKVDPRPKT